MSKNKKEMIDFKRNPLNKKKYIEPYLKEGKTIYESIKNSPRKKIDEAIIMACKKKKFRNLIKDVLNNHKDPDVKKIISEIKEPIDIVIIDLINKSLSRLTYDVFESASHRSGLRVSDSGSLITKEQLKKEKEIKKLKRDVAKIKGENELIVFIGEQTAKNAKNWEEQVDYIIKVVNQAPIEHKIKKRTLLLLKDLKSRKQLLLFPEMMLKEILAPLEEKGIEIEKYELANG